MCKLTNKQNDRKHFRSLRYILLSTILELGETLGCSRVEKSRVQKVKFRHSSQNSTRSGETPLTIVETRVRRELALEFPDLVKS